MRTAAGAFALLIAATLCAATPPQILPSTPTPARNVVVVNWEPGAVSDRPTDLAIRSLQGLVNRTTPVIWVNNDTTEIMPGWWLNKMIQMGLVDGVSQTLSVSQFLANYKGYASGAVIPPDSPADLYHVAVCRAALEDAIVCNEATATSLGLPIIADYRGMFADLADALEHIRDNFIVPDLMNEEAVMYLRDDLRTSTYLVDYAIQHRLMTFTLHGGADEFAAIEDILYELPDNIPVLGSPGGGTGYINEGDLIRLLSMYGKYLIGCGGTQNLSYRTGLPPIDSATAAQTHLRTTPTYNPTKIYVSCQISDGDNTNTQRRRFVKKDLWENRGQVPVGWTMAPLGYELVPAIYRYFYEVLPPSPLDEFVTGMSGVGYCFPAEYAKGEYTPAGQEFPVERRNAARDEFFEQTAAYMEWWDHRIVSTQPYYPVVSPPVMGLYEFERYAYGLPGCYGILNGYNETASIYGANAETYAGLPVFHNAVDMQYGGDLVSAVLSAAGAERPAFVHIFWIPTIVDFDWGIAQLLSLPSNCELVLPSEFAAFYRQANELPIPGWSDTGTIAGHVLNTLGQGIAGATVYAIPGGASDITDGDGYYEIPGLPNDEYMLRASATHHQAVYKYNVWVQGSTTTADITLTAQVTSPAGQLAAGWNMMALPLSPEDPSVDVVLADAAAAGNTLTNNLFLYFPTLGYLIYPGEFGEMLAGEGCWLYLDYDCTNTVRGAIPQEPYEVTMGNGWNLIGSPSADPVAWADCQVRSGAETKSLADAVAAGWIEGTAYYYDGGYKLVRPSGGDDQALRPWRAHWVLTHQAWMTLIIPTP